MPMHSHTFVEEYTGLVGYGMDRPTDEATLAIYLQKFGDDECLKKVLPRMSREDMDTLFDLISGILRRTLEEPEYHRFFLKEDEDHH